MKSCPLCENKTLSFVQEVTSAQAARHYHMASATDERYYTLLNETESLWNTDKAQLLQCDTCDLIFCDPFVSGSQKFYETAYDTEQSYPDWKWGL